MRVRPPVCLLCDWLEMNGKGKKGEGGKGEHAKPAMKPILVSVGGGDDGMNPEGARLGEERAKAQRGDPAVGGYAMLKGRKEWKSCS